MFYNYFLIGLGVSLLNVVVGVFARSAYQRKVKHYPKTITATISHLELVGSKQEEVSRNISKVQSSAISEES